VLGPDLTANVTANNPEEARQAPKLWGFFDGSGTHSGARVCTVAALAGEYAAFEALDARWKHVLQDPTWPSRLAEFHTVECVNQTGKFKGWSYAERLAILGRLVSAIVETPGLLAIGSSLLCDDLLTMPKQDLELLKAQGLGTPTDLCFQHLLQRIINRTREYGEREQIGLVFDDEPTEGERYNSSSITTKQVIRSGATLLV